MKKFILLILTCILFIDIQAERISSRDAIDIADSFMNSRHLKKSGNLQPSVTSFGDELYIVNNPGGGWAVVSADDRLPKTVLGYSPEGFLDINALPVGIKGVLENYAVGIRELNAKNLKPINSTTSAGKSVAPLLGEIKWDQGEPYNSMCPEIESGRALVGCVPNAIGQIMYYYRYPEKGRGSSSYTWNGTTLSMDFSQSVYQWDLMKPEYDGSENAGQIQAVAKLLYDLGIALQVDYGFLTGGSLWGIPMVKYFDYDPSIKRVESWLCKRSDFEEIIREDLDAGHPVFVQGYNEYGGGHAYVCDGYNEEGYFHFNMGGGSGGYFVSTATGYGLSQTIFCSIKPNENGSSSLWAGSDRDLFWTGGNDIKCHLKGGIESGLSSNIDVALALEASSGDIEYFIKNPGIKTGEFEINSLTFEDEVKDGEYKLYPVCRIDGGEWQKIYFADNAADHIEVSVKDGVKSYTNTSTGGAIDSDVIEIDGVYYRINGDEATVTSRNNLFNSYSGDVMIPDNIIYEGEIIPVTRIGENAFCESVLGNVTIGSNVHTIEMYAFRDAKANSLEYKNEKNITTLGERAFFGLDIDYLKIPEGVSRLGFLTVSGYSQVVDIPTAINFLSYGAFSYEGWKLKEIQVHWTSADDFPEYEIDEINGFGPFGSDFANVTLHVPEGCVEIYKNHELWKVFTRIYDDESGVEEIETDGLNIVVANGMITFESLPENAEAEIYNLQGIKIASCRAGETVVPGSGIYIVKVGNYTAKVKP